MNKKKQPCEGSYLKSPLCAREVFTTGLDDVPEPSRKWSCKNLHLVGTNLWVLQIQSIGLHNAINYKRSRVSKKKKKQKKHESYAIFNVLESFVPIHLSVPIHPIWRYSIKKKRASKLRMKFAKRLCNFLAMRFRHWRWRFWMRHK